jgi:proliferating cell nuclear antigen
MTITFSAKTTEGYVLKILAELLQSNIKTACFEIDKEGIRLRMMDSNKLILIDLKLDSQYFGTFTFTKKEKIFIGVNMTHLHKMLKTIKKRDSVRLYIDDKKPNDLGIEVIPKEKNRVTTSFIKIQSIQNIDVDLPDGYHKPVIVPSGEFQKMCKGLAHLSNVTTISSKNCVIKFSNDSGDVMGRTTEFGERDSSSEEDQDTDEEPDYEDEFDTEQLIKITKIAGMATNMQIFPMKERPLLFSSQVGSIGKISVYLKSRRMKEAESRAVEEDE